MLRYLRELLRGEAEASAQASGLSGMIHEASARFAGWVEISTRSSVDSTRHSLIAADDALERAAKDQEELPEALAADAASFVGEVARHEWSGQWREDDRFGLVLRGLGQVPGAKLMPLALVEKRWNSPGRFSLAGFFHALPGRLEAEKKFAEVESASLDSLMDRVRERSGKEANEAANRIAAEFRGHWKQLHGVDIPLSLTGVRELDGFLRSHYYINCVTDGTLASAGFFIGEVGRGLFQGEWNFEGLEQIERAALRYPELDYYPVGRIFKMMTERPEGETLDEYIRLIPSARKELRPRTSD